MAIGVNWAEIWKDVWDSVWEQTAAAPQPPQTIAPSFGPFKVRDKRAKEFQKILDEGVRRHQDREAEKARALGKDREAEDAFILAEKARELERARRKREIEVLKGLRARGFVDDYPKAKLTGSAAIQPPKLKASLSGELPTKGAVKAAPRLQGILSGEHSLAGAIIQAPVITGRAGLEMEDDAIALALGMPELTEVLGEFVRIQ